MAGRPRTPIGTPGSVNIRRRGKSTASATSAAAARRRLNEKFLVRPGYGTGGQLQPSSSFSVLAELWLADLDLRSLTEGTKHGYRKHFRLHVRPAFEHFTIAEITTGRVEWFLKSQLSYSASRGQQSRTLLNLVFAFALRHDAIGRNPVAGTSRMPKTIGSPQALTLSQVAAIRAAAASWRTEPGLPGPTCRTEGSARPCRTEGFADAGGLVCCTGR